MAAMRDKHGIVRFIIPDGYVYYKTKRGMYRLKQAAQLAYDVLLINLKKYGHAPDKYSPNMWVHETCTTKCCLCVDNCGAKYTSRGGAQYLINTLQENYYITIDWSG